MSMTQWSGKELLKQYGLIVARKMGFIALGWVGVYFISQPFRSGGFNLLVLFGPVIGALAGLVAGWYMATDAVEESSLHGLTLWVVLVIGAVAPMWFVEGVMHLIRPRWEMGFGGFMVLTAANLLAMAAAVWHASSQE